MVAPEYKKPIPAYVKNIGIVTAPTGAAIRDIMNIAGRRNPFVQLYLYPALVQGEGAKESIVRGIRLLDKQGVDVIIVGRGGGSMEDLWAFNEEMVASCLLYTSFLSEEKYLNRLSELLEIAISWILKTVLALVVGLNIVQGIISPAVDMVKRSTLTRSAEAIPGIGDAIGGVTEVVLGTAVLVKNGIGMTGAIICVSLCLIPIVEIGCIVLMYKLTAALLEPVSNERVIGCIESVSEGGRLLIKVVFTVGLLFLVTIVIVSAVTGNV